MNLLHAKPFDITMTQRSTPHKRPTNYFFYQGNKLKTNFNPEHNLFTVSLKLLRLFKTATLLFHSFHWPAKKYSQQ